MKSPPLNIPGDNEIVFSPDPSQIHALIKENQKRVKKYKFSIFGKNFISLREAYRQYLIKNARIFTDRLDANIDQKVRKEYSHASYLIITGHQPEFYHPGVWIKNLFLSELIKQDKTGQYLGINLNLDNDIVNPIQLYCPSVNEADNKKNSGYLLHKINLLSKHQNIPLQEMEIPSKQEISQFLLGVNSKINQIPDLKIYKRFQRFTDNLWKAYQLCQDDSKMNQLGIFMIACRRYFESPLKPAYEEIPHSFLANYNAFLLFFLEIASNIRSFALIYNQKLAQYRISHKIKNKENPMTDLLIEQNRVEAPFWIWQNGKKMGREKVFLSNENDGRLYLDLTLHRKILLISNEKEDKSLILQNLKGIMNQNRFIISPRALILTLFQRLFGADLFIHGIGGSKYDLITDGLIQEYFKVEPPGYFSVSATIPLDFPHQVKNQNDLLLSALRKKQRQLIFNPEKVIGEAALSIKKEQEAHVLINEKMKVIQEINKANSGDKYYLSQKIKTLNQKINEILSPYETYLTGKIAETEKKEKQEKILRFREYPYCFYNGEKIASLLKNRIKEEL